MFNTPLKGAVDHTFRLLQAFCQPDDSQFDSAVQAIDQRVLDTARGFLELMRRGGATLRIVAGDHESRFLPADVARGAERAKSVDTAARQDAVPGQLRGVLPDSRQFEFCAEDDRGTMRGPVSGTFTADQLVQLNRELADIDSLALFQATRVLRTVPR